MFLNIKNTYYNELPAMFYSIQKPTKVKNPKLIVLNEKLISEFKNNIDIKNESTLTDIFSGNKLPETSIPIAQAYAGHQFAYFNMLGDGRAILLGEIIKDKKLYDLQLKGSGKTPYSRGGDGRAALAPMLREYIISEAMYFLGVPTTRSLAVVGTGEIVYREVPKIGAILSRIASSHIRVGTFEYALNFGKSEDLKKLADYTINRLFPHINTKYTTNKKYLEFFKNVTELQAKLIAKWSLIGFIHGVMNTDNVSISGETIDYGPCAFMDTYDPDTVFSSIDTFGRYRYKNQPYIANWNLTVFAETLLPLFSYTYDEEDKDSLDEKKSIELIEKELLNFNKLYQNYWLAGMRAKLGLFEEKENDGLIFNRLLKIMEKYRADYTNVFVALTTENYEDKTNKDFYTSTEFKIWKEEWKLRQQLENKTKKDIKYLMQTNNPLVIPRNRVVEVILKDCENKNFTSLKKFLEILSRPYDYSQKIEDMYLRGNTDKSSYRTYCGT